MVPPLTLCAYMKKGPNLRWSLIQCSGGDEGDRTPDLLTASQALSHQAPPRPPPGPPATKPAHLLRLAGIPRPWRLGQK